MGDDATQVERELDGAREGLADARLLLKQGGSVNGVVNRLYYACFHAARAVLYDRDLNPTSHGGVRTLFGQHVVLGRDVPREMGRLLSDLYDYRTTADYEADEPDVDVEELAADAERFVDHAAGLVD